MCHTAAETAVVQPWQLFLFPAALPTRLSGRVPAVTKTKVPDDIRISHRQFHLLVLRLVFRIDWGRLYNCPGRYRHRERVCGCVLAHHKWCRLLTPSLAVVGNWVPKVMLAMGEGNPPVVRVLIIAMGWFDYRPVLKPRPLTLGRVNPDRYMLTCGLRRAFVWLDGKNLPVWVSLFIFMVAFRYATGNSEKLTLVHHG
jgi:hypothetical protein